MRANSEARFKMSNIDMDGWHEKLMRHTKSQTTVDNYVKGIARWERFAKERLNQTLQQSVDSLIANPLTLYDTLDKFVGWVNALKVVDPSSGASITLMPNTVILAMSATKSFLRYHGVEISNERYKEKVSLPAIEELGDVPLEKKDARKLLMSGAPMWIRAGAALMMEAGTRIGETTQIRVKYVHLDENPIRIEIKKETTKATKRGRMEREVFMTSEAGELFRSLVESQHLGPEDQPFFKTANPADYYRKILTVWLVKLGLAGKIEGHSYHKIHPHIFRKFFFSNSVGPMGETAAHAFMGHQFYLKTYFKRPLADRQADYLKAAPYLMVLQASSTEDLRKKILFDNLRLTFNLKEDQIQAIEKMFTEKNAFEPDEEILGAIRDLVAKSLNVGPGPRGPLGAGVA